MPSPEHRSRRPSSARLDAVDALHHHSVDALDTSDPSASFRATEDRRNRRPVDAEVLANAGAAAVALCEPPRLLVLF